MLGKKTRDETTRRPEPTPRAVDRGMSLISKDMRIKGDLIAEGRIRIQGKITGNVTATGLELESTGSVDGDVSAPDGAAAKEAFVIDGSVAGSVRASVVEVKGNGAVNGGVVADDAVIHGHVRGGVLARTRLTLEETAAVEGDVRARRLALKEGGQVNGTIRMGDQAARDLAEAEPGPSAKDATRDDSAKPDENPRKGSSNAPVAVAARGPA